MTPDIVPPVARSQIVSASWTVPQHLNPILRSPPTNIHIDHLYISTSGFVLATGWMRNQEYSQITLGSGTANLDLPVEPSAVLRHKRQDAENGSQADTVDKGWILLSTGHASGRRSNQPVTVSATSSAARVAAEMTPEFVADRRLLDMALSRIGNAESHAGSDVARHAFMAGAGGEALVALFQHHVETNVSRSSVHRFRPRPVSRSFITVLFGSTEPVKLQPILFRSAGIDVGEWIYVCNSPEDAETVLRLGEMTTDLYDIPITIIVMPDNVGFGAANNVAVAHAAGDNIFLINPDVYPLTGHAKLLQAGIDADVPGDALRGGLLFYDDHTLMHSGMMIEADTVVRRATLNSTPAESGPDTLDLLRVEHFDKGVPFVASDWTKPVRVPAITGAMMAFRRSYFERLGGFSTRFIYGHYEDADLSFRWAALDGGPPVGPVLVDSRLRLVHLEGQGSRPRGDQYRGAAILNRHLFTLRYGDAFSRNSIPFTRTSTFA